MKTPKTVKRALSLLIVMLMLVSLVPLGTISASAVESISGDGTPGNPYLIGTPEGLKKFSEIVNGGQRGAYAKLISDIEINPGKKCGTSGYLGAQEVDENSNYVINSFQGVFDGQGHTISGLYTEYGYMSLSGALFSCPKGAVIKNSNIDRTYISCKFDGGLIYKATDTTVINCHSNAYYASQDSDTQIGGIASQAYNSKFISCTNTGRLTFYRDDGDEQRFGGIVGYAENCTFVDCKNTATIDIIIDNMPQSDVGGIVGVAKTCSFFGCINYATLLPHGGVIERSRGGGIVGSVRGETSIIGCVNNGCIYGMAGCKTAGGIIGSCPYDSYSEIKIRDCLNTGAGYVSNPHLNVFIGNMYYANVSIDNCFTRGCFVYNITADTSSKLKISNSYYEDREVCYTTSYGEYKTELNNTIKFTDEMRESGEIAYILNKNSSSVKIGQDLDVQYYPSINSEKVYYGYENCKSTEKTYSNDFRYETEGIGHIYDEKGICTLCGASGGSEECPYPISTAEDLRNFADAVNGGSSTLCAKLMNDIDLNPGTTFNIADGTYTGDEPTKWTPMGTTEYPYCGTFDGAGYKISGLYTDDSNVFSGLFGNCDAADNKAPVIKNLSVDNSSISASTVAGGIAAYISNGTVSNCSSSDSVFIHSSSTGGIAGISANCAISDCSSSSAVISSRSWRFVCRRYFRI